MHGDAKRNWRLTQLVGAMKRNEYPNARSMVARLTRTGDPRARTSSRIRAPEVLPTRFARDEVLIAGIRQGNVFDYEAVGDVVVECDADKARVIAERE